MHRVSAGAHRPPNGYAADVPPTADRFGRLVLLAAFVAALVGCTGDASLSFDPTGPCTSDGAAPGAYPDLEARLPTTYRDAGPEVIDSGRNCSTEKLGVLAELGFDEIRFAGATWSFGAERAVVLAVFTAPALTADAVADFYAESARAGNRTEVLSESSPTIANRPARRLDAKTVERLQTVVVWPSAEPDIVNVVITNDLPDARIQDAIDAFGER